WQPRARPASAARPARRIFGGGTLAPATHPCVKIGARIGDLRTDLAKLGTIATHPHLCQGRKRYSRVGDSFLGAEVGDFDRPHRLAPLYTPRQFEAHAGTDGVELCNSRRSLHNLPGAPISSAA